MKGSMEGVLPMMALFLLSLVLAVQGMPISAALASIAGDSGEKVGEISELKSESEHELYREIPRATSYAVNDEAYSLAEDEGGIEWQTEDLSSKSLLMYNLRGKWEDAVEENLKDRLDDINFCHSEGEFSVNIYPAGTGQSLFHSDLEDAVFNVESSKIICESNRNEMVITDYEEYYRSERNRYIEILKYTIEFFTSVEDEYSSAPVSNNYEGHDRSSCGGSASTSDAEDEAVNSYEDDTPSINSIAGEISTPNGIITEESAEDQYTVTSSGTSQGPCCSGCGDPNTTNSYYEDADVTISPTETEIDMEVEDEEEEIIVEREYKNLGIEVEDYKHSWN